MAQVGDLVRTCFNGDYRFGLVIGLEEQDGSWSSPFFWVYFPAIQRSLSVYDTEFEVI